MLPFIDLNITPEELGGISVFDFLSFFIFIFTAKSFFNSSKKNTIYSFLFSLLVVLIFIGSIKSEFIENSLFNFVKLFSIFIYTKILIEECLKDPAFINLTIKYLKLGCIFSLVFLFIQLIVGPKFTFYPELNPNIFQDIDLRYPSYFQDPQKYGQYLSMMSFLFLIKKENKSSFEILDSVIFLIIILAIFLTGSRAAFLGLCIGLLVFIFSQKIKIWGIAILIVLLGYLFLLNFSDYFSLFNRTDDFTNSFETRNAIWNEGLNIFFANPVFGIGIGNHHNYIMNHSINGYYIVDNEVVYYGAESGYLQYLIEYGLLSFSLFLLIILTPVFNAIKSYKEIFNFNISLLIAPILSWMVAFSTVNSLSDKRILLTVGTLLSLLIVLRNSAKGSNV